MNAGNPQITRRVWIIVSSIDMILSGILLLIYFGVLPVDISGWNISRQVLGWTAGVWFVGALAVLVYQLTKTDSVQ